MDRHRTAAGELQRRTGEVLAARGRKRRRRSEREGEDEEEVGLVGMMEEEVMEREKRETRGLVVEGVSLERRVREERWVAISVKP